MEEWKLQIEESRIGPSLAHLSSEHDNGPHQPLPIRGQEITNVYLWWQLSSTHKRENLEIEDEEKGGGLPSNERAQNNWIYQLVLSAPWWYNGRYTNDRLRVCCIILWMSVHALNSTTPTKEEIKGLWDGWYSANKQRGNERSCMSGK